LAASANQKLLSDRGLKTTSSAASTLAGLSVPRVAGLR
jgi:hypothetical protein